MSNLDNKKAVVDEIKEKLERSESVLLCNGRGLTVQQDTLLRKDLREADIEYKVYKNTLIHLAVQDTIFEGLDAYLAGPTTVAFSYEDPVIAARIIAKHQKNAKALEFKAGVISETTYDEEGITKISKIPSVEELYSKLLGSFKAPMASFVRLINAVKEDLEATAPEAVAPEVEAPEAVAPEVAKVPEAVAPEATEAPEAVAPEAVAPEVAEVPEVAAPEAVAPEATEVPEAVAPEAVAPEAVAPEAEAPVVTTEETENKDKSAE